MSISVLIATADRPDELAATLRSLAACQIPTASFEVLVADNGGGDQSATVCREASANLNIHYVDVSERGKTKALNQAIEQAKGELIVFTDDDVQFDPGWLAALWNASQDYPEHVLFGGRVTPMWPNGCPEHLTGSRYLGPLYTLLDRGDTAGPLPEFRPFGPNMAVVRSVFEGGVQFDEAIGPGSTMGVSMGDESEFARQLEARGQTAVYVPSAEVYHRIRQEQLTLRWQLERGLLYGRMLAYFDGDAHAHARLGFPRWIVRSVVSGVLSAGWHAARGRRRVAFDRLFDASVAAGQGQKSRQGR